MTHWLSEMMLFLRYQFCKAKDYITGGLHVITVWNCVYDMTPVPISTNPIHSVLCLTMWQVRKTSISVDVVGQTKLFLGVWRTSCGSLQWISYLSHCMERIHWSTHMSQVRERRYRTVITPYLCLTMITRYGRKIMQVMLLPSSQISLSQWSLWKLSWICVLFSLKRYPLSHWILEISLITRVHLPLKRHPLLHWILEMSLLSLVHLSPSSLTTVCHQIEVAIPQELQQALLVQCP